MIARSVRARLTASYLLLVAICLVLVATFVTWRLQTQYLTTYRSVVLTQARLIGRMLQQHARVGDPAPDRLERLAQESRWRDDAVIRVIGIPAIVAMGAAAPPEVRSAALGDPGQAVREDAVSGQERVFAAAPVLTEGRPVAVVHLSVPTGWVWVQLRRMLPQLGISLALGLLVAWLVGARLARGLVEPVDELTRVAEQMSAGDLGRTVQPRGADEIGRLGEMFNRMAGRLRETITTLQAEQSRLAAVVAGMVDGVIATDARGEVILSNRASGDLLRGAPPGPVLRGILGDAAGAGRITADELPPSETGGRLVEVHCAPIVGDDGRPAGAVAVLRTPLTSIKGFVETLLAGAMRDETTCRYFLGIIDGEANRLVKLVNDLLDLSQLESQRVSLEIGRVDVGALVEDTVTHLRPLAGGRTLRLHPPDGGAVALADRDRVAQVLTNLLDNAIKFTPDGGEIAVEWRAADGEVEVSVADSGQGIAAADLPHVFEPFYKADRARAAIPGGSGLGLAITKHIVEAHGGRIRVASTRGEGTTVTFTLPRETG